MLLFCKAIRKYLLYQLGTGGINEMKWKMKTLLWGFNHKQNASVKVPQRNQMSNEFYQRGLTIINFLTIFGTVSIKTWKNWPIFSSFNSFPSMPSVATGDKKQFQCLQIVFNNKTRSLVLEFSWCNDTF